MGRSLTLKLLVMSDKYPFVNHRIDPILPEDRTDTRLYQMFFVWFSANINVLAYVCHVQL